MRARLASGVIVSCLVVLGATSARHAQAAETKSADPPVLQGQLAQEIGSPVVSGMARVSTPRCSRRSAVVKVFGTFIARVTFTYRGGELASLPRPNEGNRFVMRMPFSRLGSSTPRISARVRFVTNADPEATTLRVRARRCQ